MVEERGPNSIAIHRNVEEGGDLRWLSEREGRLPLFRQFLEEESRLNNKFQRETREGRPDPRAEVLKDLLREQEVTLELGESYMRRSVRTYLRTTKRCMR